MEAVAKSYMRKGFLIYEEMRKYLVIYEEAVSQIWLCNRSLMDFLIYEENLGFFYQCKKPAATTAGILKSAQLSSSLLVQAVQYVMAGGTARP